MSSPAPRDPWSLGAFAPFAWVAWAAALALLVTTAASAAPWTWRHRFDLGVAIYIVVGLGFALWRTYRSPR